MLEKLELTWSKLTPLEEGNINQILENLPGVYRLSYKNEDTNIYVIFVGKSSNIREDLLSHIHTEKNACILNYLSKSRYFKYARIDDETIRELVYKQVCKFYQPSCNPDKLIILEDVITININ